MGDRTKKTTSEARRGLDWLLGPERVTEFFARFWTKQVLYVERSDPEHFARLLQLEDLDAVFVHSIKKLDAATPSPLAVVENRRHGAPKVRHIDPARCYDRYAKGDTLVFNSIHRRWTPVGELCRAIADRFECDVVGNAYLTPRDAQGFPAHYDTHDVFVLQLHGDKTWLLRGSGRELPLKRHGLVEGLDPDSLPAGYEITLRPGDVLYIPRGVVHEARTSTSSSLHLTVAVCSSTVEDLLLAAIKNLADRRAELREALPLSLDRAGRRALRERLCATLAALDERDVVRASDALHRHRIESASPPPVGGRFAAIDAVRELDLESRVVKRWGMAATVVAEGGRVTLAFPGDTLSAPAFTAPALEFVRARSAFRVRDLPGGLSDQAKKVLVRRLIELGFLELDTVCRSARRLPARAEPCGRM